MARIRGVICYNEVIEQQTCGKRVHWLLVVKAGCAGKELGPDCSTPAPRSSSSKKPPWRAHPGLSLPANNDMPSTSSRCTRGDRNLSNDPFII